MMNINQLLAMGFVPNEDQLPMSLVTGGGWNPCCRCGSVSDLCANQSNNCPPRPCPPSPCPPWPPVVQRVSFTLTKVDQNGAPLSGAVFQLAQSEGSDILTQTVGASGTATFAVLPNTTYILTEIEVPPGYLPMTETPSIYVSPCGTVYVDGVPTQSPTFVNVAEASQAVLQFSKVNEQLQPLACAVFSLTDSSCRSRTASSDVTGLVNFGTLTPGSYVLREVVPPCGYQQSCAQYPVEVYPDGVITVNGYPVDEFYAINYPIVCS